MSICCSPMPRPHRGGFTLIELLVVIAVIAILVGLPLLTLEGNRLMQNQALARAALTQVSQGESQYFATHRTYTDDLTQFRLKPQQGGYSFHITLTGLGAAPSGYQVMAAPAAPGLTGEITFSTAQDAGGKIAEGPTPGAAAARQQAFDAIRIQENQTLEPLLLSAAQDNYEGTPQQRLTLLQKTLADPKTTQTALKKLDADGDGSVTLAELLAYDKDPSSPIGGLLASVGTNLQIGAGGEDISAVPGAALADLAPKNLTPGRLELLAAGRSQVVASPTGALPVVQLTGFTLGGVQFPAGGVSLFGAPFAALLTAPNGGAVTGPVTIGGATGPLLTGELIGLPAVQRFGGSLQGVLILTGGRGPFQNALGSGSVQIGWDSRSLNGLFVDRTQASLTVPSSNSSPQ